MYLVVVRSNTGYEICGPFQKREVAEKAVVAALRSGSYHSAKVIRKGAIWTMVAKENGYSLTKELEKMGIVRPKEKVVPATPDQQG